MKIDVIVLGAGIVGVSTALHLQKRGRSVALVDRGRPGDGTSYGNAGLIERSSVIPYAFPRSLGLLAKYALNRTTAVRYDPSYLPTVARFLYRYWRASSPENLKRATEAMLPLIEASVDEHDALIEAAGAQDLIRSDGWISLWRKPSKFRDAIREAETLGAYRLAYTVLDMKDLSKLEPDIRTGSDVLAGAIHWHDPKTVTDPGELVKCYAALFQRDGGLLCSGDAASLRRDSGTWSVEAGGQRLVAGEVVVALGPQSDDLIRRFGLTLPFGIKRGHHRHYRPPIGMPRHVLADEESGYVMSPMAMGLRLATGIEFARPDAPPNTIQIGRAEHLARQIVDLGDAVETVPWLGLRSCLPDMLPVIGRAPGIDGMWFNFGHAHHGLTLGPASARLLAETMTGSPGFCDVAPYSAARFG